MSVCVCLRACVGVFLYVCVWMGIYVYAYLSMGMCV